MPIGFNRALQVRAADRLRRAIPRDTLTDLPAVDAMSEVQQRELCEAGGGRLAAVAVGVAHEHLGDLARRLETHVRRTDLLVAAGGEALVVLAPGLDAVGGQCLAERLRDLLRSAALDVRIGTAYRCAASGSGWTARDLAAEAAAHATPASLAA